MAAVIQFVRHVILSVASVNKYIFSDKCGE